MQSRYFSKIFRCYQLCQFRRWEDDGVQNGENRTKVATIIFIGLKISSILKMIQNLFFSGWELINSENSNLEWTCKKSSTQKTSLPSEKLGQFSKKKRCEIGIVVVPKHKWLSSLTASPNDLRRWPNSSHHHHVRVVNDTRNNGSTVIS